MKRSVFFIVAALMLMLLVFGLIGFVISQDLGIGKTVVDKDGVVTINGNDYNVKSGSKLIVSSEGLGEGTSFVAAEDGGVYRLKGIDIKLPENAEVLFKDNKVIIKLPENSQLDTLNIIDKGKATGTKFEFADGEKGFKLPSGDLFTGKTLTYELDENGKGNLYFSDKEADLGGLKIKNPKEDKINLDFKGEISKEYAGNYISIDSENSKLVIGKNNPGAGIEVEKTGKNVIYQAGKDADARDKAGPGTIVIDEKEKTKVQTYGDFKIYNGGIGLSTGINSRGEKTILATPNMDKSKESIPMELINYDSEGKVLGKEPKKIIINDKNELSTSVLRDASNLDSETGQVTRITFGNPGSSGSSRNINIPASELKVSNAQQYAQYDNNPRFSGMGDLSGDVHEDIHVNINNVLSQGDNRAFYLGNGEYALIKEAGLSKGMVGVERGSDGTSTVVPSSGTTQYIPMEAVVESTTKNYFGSMFGNRDVTHVFEDDSAFRGGAKAYMNQVLTTGRGPQFPPGDLLEVSDFIVYDLAAGMYVQNEKANYWNSENGIQFRGYMKRAIEDNVGVINQAYTDPRLAIFRNPNNVDEDWGPRLGVQEKLNQLRTSQTPQAIAMRKFAQDTYGAQWTRTNLGF